MLSKRQYDEGGWLRVWHSCRLSARIPGARRLCVVAETITTTINRHLEDGHVPSRSREAFEAFLVLFEVTHAIGHMARDDWDRSSLKGVMAEFKRSMRGADKSHDTGESAG